MKQDLIGQQFERLLVISEAGRSKHRNILWLCRCDCGVERIVEGSNLKSGDTKSCGCLNRQLVAERFTIHCQAKTPEHKTWTHAKRRCTNPNNENFASYGGRGIKFLLPVLEEFLAHIGSRPSKNYSLDRINNEGHYELGNIRWATREIQNGNQRTNVNLAYQGKTQHVTAWSRELGIRCNTIYDRLKRGWSVDRALGTAVKTSCQEGLLMEKVFHNLHHLVEASDTRGFEGFPQLPTVAGALSYQGSFF